jgi:hypothetical protein
MKRTLAFLSLFTSVGTLVCCALPALFVVLGFGAAFAGLVGTFPQLIWLSENKISIFTVGAVLLMVGGYLQWHSRQMACPPEGELNAACSTTKDWSVWIYLASVGLYSVGAFFSFLAPRIF